MSIEQPSEDAPADPDSDSYQDEELQAENEILREEIRRLRQEFYRSKRTTFRRTAIGLGVIGMLGLISAIIFPDQRTVFIALGATGIFAGLLTFYVTPERFVTSTIPEGIYRSYNSLGIELISQLGLSDRRIYLPIRSESDSGAVKLFIPQQHNFEIPDSSSLNGPFVITESDRKRGIILEPTGNSLLDEFRSGIDTEDDDLVSVVEALAESLVDQFEIAETALADVDRVTSSATVGISGSSIGLFDKFDHPIVSFIGVGMASTLNQPVSVQTRTKGDDRYEFIVVCEWDLDERIQKQ